MSYKIIINWTEKTGLPRSTTKYVNGFADTTVADAKTEAVRQLKEDMGEKFGQFRGYGECACVR